jgi:hypothetical protein
MSVVVKSYLSPTLVLLAFDWAAGQGREELSGVRHRANSRLRRSRKELAAQPNRIRRTRAKPTRHA